MPTQNNECSGNAVSSKYPNLRPWRKGQSGNPMGKKPGTKHLDTQVGDLLRQKSDWKNLDFSKLQKYNNMPLLEALIYVLLTRALQGDLRAIEYLSKTAYRS